ncbi:Protein of unknown function (DUF3172) (Partial), partial [Seminavis robusta]|eukprot:Sro858_g211750.1 Protein of unknown function (DUF3172) (163) ;mRNA; r:2-490
MSQPRIILCTIACLAILQGCVSFSVSSGYLLQQQKPAASCLSTGPLLARKNRRSDDFEDDYDDEDYDYYDDDDDDDYDQPPRRRRRRRRRDDLGEYARGQQDQGLNVPSSFGRRRGWRLPESVSKSLLAGVFVLGIGLGVTVDSAINTNPKDLASRDAIDQAA